MTDEFIQLQLDAANNVQQTREAKKRITALRNAHAKQWLTPLGRRNHGEDREVAFPPWPRCVHQPNPEAAFGWLFTTPFGRGLRSLQTGDDLLFVKSRWLEFLKAHASAESELEVLGFYQLMLTKTDRGWTRLSGKMQPLAGKDEQAMREYLRELESVGITVDVEVSPRR